MLIHKVPANLLIPIQLKPFISIMSSTQHMDLFFGPFHTNSGLFFTVPKQSKCAVRGQPTHPTSVPLGGTEVHAHFRPPTHQNTIYCTNSNTNCPNSPWTITKLLKWSPKISNNSVPSFGTDQTAPLSLNQLNHPQNT